MKYLLTFLVILILLMLTRDYRIEKKYGKCIKSETDLLIIDGDIYHIDYCLERDSLKFNE